MKRWILILLACPAPALAWEAGIQDGLCTLTHTEDGIDVRLVHDPSGPRYTITLTAPEDWPSAPIFGIRFEGPRPNTITTERHVLSPDRRSLSVSDSGFGNVLDGLQFNDIAIGFSGERAWPLSLEGAGPAVAAFRDCVSLPSV